MPSLLGLRVFVLEDESHIAMLIEDMLCDLGCEITATAERVADALRAVDDNGFDVAVLDVNLAGEQSFPVAERLRAEAIPFVFSTGYGVLGVREDLRTAPVIAKPFDQEELGAALVAAMNR